MLDLQFHGSSYTAHDRTIYHSPGLVDFTSDRGPMRATGGVRATDAGEWAAARDASEGRSPPPASGLRVTA